MRAQRFALVIALTLVSVPCFAAAHDGQQSPPDDAAQILKLVDAHYNHLSSLRCSFAEHFAGVGAERTESGTLLLSKPGRMRWTYTDPPGKLFLLDGRYAWFYAPGGMQVQRVPAKQLDDLRSPLRFLLGHTQLARELSGVSITSRAGGYRIAGVPKGMEQRVKEIRLDVTRDGTIQAIRIEEQGGSLTEFEFRNIIENVAVPADAFRFHAPAGVPVVDAMPPI